MATLRRSAEQHRSALGRLERLLHHSGGIFFGVDLEQQLQLATQLVKMVLKIDDIISPTEY
jgi:hypothetical protein